jgi:hypothetical protein
MCNARWYIWNDSYVSSIQNAISTQNVNLIRILAERGDFADGLLHIYKHSVIKQETIELILKSGVPFSKILPTLGNYLLNAAYTCKPELITFLIDCVIDPNPEDLKLCCEMPLISAVGRNSLKCITALVKGKADVNYTTSSRRSPIQMAVGMRRKPLTERLLELGARPTVNAFRMALGYQQSWVRRLLPNTTCLFLTPDNIKEFLTVLIKNLWCKQPWHLDIRYGININTVDMSTLTDAMDMDCVPAGKKWVHPRDLERIRSIRQDRLEILERIRISSTVDFDLKADIAISLARLHNKLASKKSIRRVVSYIFQRKTNILATMYLKQIGIPKDIRRLVVLLTFNSGSG